MAAFLTNAWFDEVNATLMNAGAVPLDDGVELFRVVLEFPDAPPEGPRAMTFTMKREGASLLAGEHLAADAVVSLGYLDALALTDGHLDSASALREGRVKVRGDVNALVPLLAWLQLAHPRSDV
ncbi:MAG: SCP2 sterol-binding domain-containing protein [Acidimicrobiales bacterium]